MVCAYKEMPHQTLLLSGRRRCADGYLIKYLPRISIHNRNAEMLGNIYACLGLTDTGRTQYDYKGFH